MCNRKIYEASLKKAFPGAKITHKVALPGTVTVEADGKQGKRWCFGNGVLCQPYPCSKMCHNGDTMVKDVKRITNAGAPPTAEFER